MGALKLVYMVCSWYEVSAHLGGNGSRRQKIFTTKGFFSPRENNRQLRLWLLGATLKQYGIFQLKFSEQQYCLGVFLFDSLSHYFNLQWISSVVKGNAKKWWIPFLLFPSELYTERCFKLKLQQKVTLFVVFRLWKKEKKTPDDTSHLLWYYKNRVENACVHSTSHSCSTSRRKLYLWRFSTPSTKFRASCSIHTCSLVPRSNNWRNGHR